MTPILSPLYICRYVLKELVETEKHYVVDLGFIVEVTLTVCRHREEGTYQPCHKKTKSSSSQFLLFALVCFQTGVSGLKQIWGIISWNAIML